MTPTDNTACSCDQASCSCHDEEAASRRRFLQRATTITLGALSLTILPGWAENDDDDAADDDPLDEEAVDSNAERTPVYGFLVDAEKCVGTGKCLTACRTENNVPEGNHRTWVERYVHFKDGTIQVDTVPETGYAGSGLPIIDADKVDRSYFVPKMCNHCEDAPCNQVCPVHASFTSPEGMELVDTERCIGCAYCVQACPYGARFINSETGTADKCTWCYHRVTKGEQPACVESCPVGARLFGRVDDPTSEIAKRIAEVPTHVLKEYLGTHPKAHYVGISREVT
jgi:Fe-S-cluster-containing dehydrogenase component